MTELQILPELQQLIPHLKKEEYDCLEASILEDGVRDPIITTGACECGSLHVIETGTGTFKRVCQGCGTFYDMNLSQYPYLGVVIIDGHNRYEIAKKHNLDFSTHYIPFEDFDCSADNVKLWMIDNQKGRRNLSDYQFYELSSTKKEILAKKGRENLKTNIGGAHVGSPESGEGIAHDTQNEIAEDLGWSKGKISQADVINKKADGDLKGQLRQGNISINKAWETVKTIEDIESVDVVEPKQMTIDDVEEVEAEEIAHAEDQVNDLKRELKRDLGNKTISMREAEDRFQTERAKLFEKEQQPNLEVVYHDDPLIADRQLLLRMAQTTYKADYSEFKKYLKKSIDTKIKDYEKQRTTA